MIGTRCKRGTRFEVSTNTRDPSLQLVYADPYGSLTQLGLSVPAAIPSFYPATPWANRYLALLVSVKFVNGEVARLVGMRQRVLIGETDTTDSGSSWLAYQAQTTPEWHFSDANVSWHLRRVPLEQIYTSNVNNAAESMFRTAQTPAILYENAPGQAGGYGPPNGGLPPGNVLIPEFGDFHDLRFPWADDRAWDSLDIECRGPCAINLYASIQQTNPDTRPDINDQSYTAAQLALLPPEDQFVAAFSSAVYTRIAGSLIFETEDMYGPTGEVSG